jgi:hypothetical protein
MALGDAVLDVDMRIKRCVMTTRPQAGGVERDLDVLTGLPAQGRQRGAVQCALNVHEPRGHADAREGTC